MPEGPEIRIAGDSIAKVLQGQLALRVSFAFERLQPYQSALEGQLITQVETRGKGMLIHFESGLAIYSHNNLYGRWITTRAAEAPSTNRQIRLSITTSKGAAWLLSASDIEVLDEDGRSLHSYLSKLGPDPLLKGCDPEALLLHWDQSQFQRRSLAVLFLDQAFLAGVGNYLRSEILFVAGLSPEIRLNQLSAEARARLALAALEICRQAYRLKGITNDAEMAKKLRLQGWKRRDYRHWVFGREGKACHRCQTAIEKTVLAGRRLYNCPGCQI